MTRSKGYIDFSDMDDVSFDRDGWRDDIERDGKLYIPQGKKCHETHPDLDLGGGTLLGGNCRDHKRHKNVSLYVALDYGMAHPTFDAKTPIARCVYYPISNMKAPTNPAKFHDLVDEIIRTLALGQRVHVGCIGGHGRTGLVLAAVVAKLGVTEDAITWVRSNYCARAIESKEQENFLVINFGVLPVPAKSMVDKRKFGV